MIRVPRAKQPGETQAQRLDYLATFVPADLLAGFFELIMRMAHDEDEAQRMYELTLMVFGAGLVWADEQYRKVS